MKLKHVQPEFAHVIADDLIPHLQRIVDRSDDGSWTIHGIFHRIYSGQWMLWLVQNDDNTLNGIAVTQTVPDMQNRLVCHILFLVGSGWKDWGPDLLSSFEQEAFKNGIYAVEWEGREGWSPLLKDYKKARVVMRKVLHHG